MQLKILVSGTEAHLNGMNQTGPYDFKNDNLQSSALTPEEVPFRKLYA
ncbi:MAG: hypothetical protein PHD01_06740 [Geobacteraceae bacterium]|nr:hypothetical protein [Geobacteraceae bacterium]